jgi:hypothetical protein
MRPPSDSDTMRHLTDADVAAAIWADLGADAVGTIDAAARRAHLEVCSACRTRLDDAQRLDAAATQLLRTLDSPRLPFDAADVIAIAQHRNTRPRRRFSQALAASLIAVVVTCAVGAVAFAFPTSPLGRWLRQITTSIMAPAYTRSEPRTSVVPPADLSAGGVAVMPTDPLTIVFRVVTPPAVRVRYCDTTLATLRVLPHSSNVGSLGTTTTSGQVRFSVSSNRISVTTADSQDVFELTLPLNTASARIIDSARGIVTPLPPPRPELGTRGCRAPMMVPLLGR